MFNANIPPVTDLIVHVVKSDLVGYFAFSGEILISLGPRTFLHVLT